MKFKSKLIYTLLVAMVMFGAAYWNRIYILQYSLGWYTDFFHPRSANQPVPWSAGPLQPTHTLGKRPPDRKSGV